ncbi:hypothetical protein NE237_014050 [Protea cynaroides]|uniref:BHLH domain-containing protein n=1 Tax=Protea cynaroides TaxID=273540 RepID=A0A9Q0H451_9MAGN|nr:hypothetical protein NE237_014050 [Protea cynaroides]
MSEGGGSFSNLFDDSEFGNPTQLGGVASPNDLFSILETLESAMDFDETTVLVSPNVGAHKRQKLSEPSTETTVTNNPDELQQRMTHITVERNRRKHLNDHLSVLRSLVPCFYVKRGDQASIIGGVVDYIKELQQVLQSLEAKKQRKVYSNVLSPRLVSSPRSSKPPLLPPSSILSLPISPRTPQAESPYLPTVQQGYLLPTNMGITQDEAFIDNLKELSGNSKSEIAEVEVKFSGPNVLLKTISLRIPGQTVKIVAALEGLALEILHVSINTIDETMLNSFTIKIGIECQLSAEELANEIQQTFCYL